MHGFFYSETYSAIASKDKWPGGYPHPVVRAAPIGRSRAVGQALHMDVNDTRARLIRLQAERHQALELGIERPSPYLTRLDAALAEAHVDYVTSAVVEIAVLRRSLAGAAQG